MSELTLGLVIRGARLGYGWCDRVNGFVRVVDAGPSRWRINVVPPNRVPNRPTDEEHRVWWADGGEPVHEVVHRIVAGGLRVRALRRSVEFFVDDDGEAVR